jgi:hypothetical protein
MGREGIRIAMIEQGARRAGARSRPQPALPGSPGSFLYFDEKEVIPMAGRKARIGFGYHLTAFIAVTSLMVWINLDTSPQYFWAKWPLAGWAVGLLFHGFSVFSSSIRINRGFSYHLVSYLIINALLIFINLDLSPYYLWFKFPLMAWTVMIAFHAWRVFSHDTGAAAGA